MCEKAQSDPVTLVRMPFAVKKIRGGSTLHPLDFHLKVNNMSVPGGQIAFDP